MPEGIDVSKWQGTNINWPAVAGAGKDFVIARASIAGRTKDETFPNNYKGIVNAGMIPGAYHLVSGVSDGPTQATNFGQALNSAGFDKGLLVLDVEGWSETTGANVAGTIKAVEFLCNWIRSTYKRDPIIYTGVYWRDDMKQHPNTYGAELWLSYYGADPTPWVPTAWKQQSWRIWQYTDKGRVAGISGDVDLNKNSGTLRGLKSLAGWEWDELATPTEIRNIVAEEMDKRVQTFVTADSSGVDRVLTSLSDTESRLAAEITQSYIGEEEETNRVLAAIRETEDRITNTISSISFDTMSRDELIVRLSELGDLVANMEYDEEFMNLSALIIRLHNHLCARVDLHTDVV